MEINEFRTKYFEHLFMIRISNQSSHMKKKKKKNEKSKYGKGRIPDCKKP